MKSNKQREEKKLIKYDSIELWTRKALKAEEGYIHTRYQGFTWNSGGDLQERDMDEK